MQHIYHDLPCPACGRYYCRFADTEACPFCDSAEAPTFDLVTQVFDGARASLVASGSISLTGYRPVTQADRYLMLGFELLEAYRQHVELLPELVAEEAVRQYAAVFGHREAVEEHWRRYFVALLTHWREHRNSPL